MTIKIRRTFVVIEERREEAGRVANPPLRRVAAVAVVENPYARRYVDDLAPGVVSEDRVVEREAGRRAGEGDVGAGRGRGARSSAQGGGARRWIYRRRGQLV